MNDDAYGDETLVARLRRETKGIIYGMLYAMLKESKGSRKKAFAGAVIETLQLVAFPLHAALPTTTAFLAIPGATWLSTGAYLFSAPFIMNLFSDFVTLYWLATLAVALALCNAIYVGWAHSNDTYHALWPVKLLRFGVSVFASIGYIPVLTILLTGWLQSDVQITSKVLGGGIAVASFIPLSLAFSLVFYEPSQKSASYSARPHSRIQFITLVVKTILVFSSVTLTYMASLDDYPYLGYMRLGLYCAMVAMSLVLATATAVFLPYYNPRLNYLRSFLLGTLVWITTYQVCVAYTSVWSFSGLGLWLGAVLSGGFFCSLAKANWTWWGRLVPSKDAEGRRVNAPDSWIPTPFHVEIAARALLSKREDPNSAPSSDMLTALDKLYQAGMSKFPTSSYLVAMYVLHLDVYRKASKVVSSELQRAKQMEQWLDGSFLLFRLEQDRSRVATTAKDAGTGEGMDFLAQIEFRRSMEAVSKAHRRALKMVRRFWMLMLNSRVDFAQLQSRSAAIKKVIVKHERTLNSLMRKFPSSPSVFRSYAAYLSQIRNQPERAEDYFRKASTLESDLARSRKTSEGKVTASILDENSALVAANHAGIMTFVSVQAARMFGYQSSELIGQNVSLMVPRSDVARHNLAMERQAAHAAGDTSRPPSTFHASGADTGGGRELVVTHANGSLFVCRMTMSTVLLGGEETFVGAFSLDPMASGHVLKQLFVSMDSLKLLGATSAAAAWIGCESNELNDMHLSALVPDFESTVSASLVKLTQANSPSTPSRVRSTPPGSPRASVSSSPIPTRRLTNGRRDSMAMLLGRGSIMDELEAVRAAPPVSQKEASLKSDLHSWEQLGSQIEMLIMSREYGAVNVSMTPHCLPDHKVVVLTISVPEEPAAGSGSADLLTPMAAGPLTPVPESDDDDVGDDVGDDDDADNGLAGSELRSVGGRSKASRRSGRSAHSARSNHSGMSGGSDWSYHHGERHGASSAGGASGHNSSVQGRSSTGTSGRGRGGAANKWARLQRRLVQESTRHSDGIKLLNTVVIAVTLMFIGITYGVTTHLSSMTTDTIAAVPPILMSEGRVNDIMIVAHEARFLQAQYMGIDTQRTIEDLMESLHENAGDVSGKQLELVNVQLGDFTGIGASGFNINMSSLVPLTDGGFFVANGTEEIIREVDLWEALTLYASQARSFHQDLLDNEGLHINNTDALENNPYFHALVANPPIGLIDGTRRGTDLLEDYISAQIESMTIYIRVLTTFVIATSAGLIWCSIRPVVYLVTDEKNSSMSIFAALDMKAAHKLAEKRRSLLSVGDQGETSDEDDFDDNILSDNEDEEVSRGTSVNSTSTSGGGKGSSTRRIVNVDATTSSVHRQYMIAGLLMSTVFLGFMLGVGSIAGNNRAADISDGAYRASVCHTIDFALSEIVGDPTSTEKREQMTLFLDQLEEVHTRLGYGDSQEALDLAYGDMCGVLADWGEECSDWDVAEVEIAQGAEGLMLKFMDYGRTVVQLPASELIPTNQYVDWITRQNDAGLELAVDWAEAKFAEEWMDELETAQSQLRAVGGVAFFVALAAYVVAYRPMVRFLVAEMSSIGFMISLVPLEAIQRNRTIKVYLMRKNNETMNNGLAEGGAVNEDQQYASHVKALARSFRTAKSVTALPRVESQPHVKIAANPVIAPVGVSGTGSGEATAKSQGVADTRPRGPDGGSEQQKQGRSIWSALYRRGAAVDHPVLLAVGLVGFLTAAMIIAMTLIGRGEVIRESGSLTSWSFVGAAISGCMPFSFAFVGYGLSDYSTIAATSSLLGAYWFLGVLTKVTVSIWAWFSGLPMDTTVVTFTAAGACLSSALVLMAPSHSPLSAEMSTIAAWGGLVLALPFVKQKARNVADSLHVSDVDGFLRAELFTAGLVGGYFNAELGHSADTTIYALLYLFYRMDVRVAALSSITAAGINSVWCLFVSLFFTEGAILDEGSLDLIAIAGNVAPFAAILGAMWISKISADTAFYSITAVMAMSVIMSAYASFVVPDADGVHVAEAVIASGAARAGILGVAVMTVLWYLVGIGGIVRLRIVSRRSADTPST